MKAYRADDKLGWQPIALLPHKAAWRDAHSLLKLNETNTQPPAAVEYLAERVAENILSRESRFRLHAIGMATAPNKAGKFLLWRHDRMPVAAGLLRDPDVMEQLREGITTAEELGMELRRRMRRVCRLYLAPDADTSGRDPAREDVDRLADSLNVLSPYWTHLEEPFYRLLDDLPTNLEAAVINWRQIIKRVAECAFSETCASLGTSARALRAVARVNPFFGDRPVAMEVKT
jgi:CRISPR system Cascade subunit CasA